MRSLGILLFLCVEGLARGAWHKDEWVNIRGEELRRIMTCPIENIPLLKGSTSGWNPIALVTFTYNGALSILYCDKGKRRLSFMVLQNSQERLATFLLDHSSLSINGTEVNDNDIFQVLPRIETTFQDGKLVVPERRQHVAYTELDLTWQKQLFSTTAMRFSSHYCKSPDIVSSNTFTLCITSEPPLPFRYVLNCDKETIDLTRHDEKTVEVFLGTGIPDVPISYSWKTQTYLNNIPINSDRWVSIMYNKGYREEFMPQPLKIAQSKRVAIRLFELKDDLKDLCSLMSISPYSSSQEKLSYFLSEKFNKPRGYVRLGDRKIASLSRIVPNTLGEEACLIRVRGSSDPTGERHIKKIIFRGDEFRNEDGTAWSDEQAKRVYLHKRSALPTLVSHYYVRMYIELATIKRLLRHISEKSYKSDPKEDRRDFSVNFVYNNRFKFSASFYGGGAACTKDLKVLRAHKQGNFVQVNEKTNIDFVCYIRILDDDPPKTEYLVTRDRVLDDGFAVQLDTYTPRKQNAVDFEYQEMETKKPGWKAYAEIPKKR